MKRKMVSALLCATMVAGMVVVPAATAQAADKKVIGVTMPTKDLQRWNQDGENMKKELEAAGYKFSCFLADSIFIQRRKHTGFPA